MSSVSLTVSVSIGTLLKGVLNPKILSRFRFYSLFYYNWALCSKQKDLVIYSKFIPFLFTI